jgi:chromatin remodeling complex protein RSC6
VPSASDAPAVPVPVPATPAAAAADAAVPAEESPATVAHQSPFDAAMATVQDRLFQLMLSNAAFVASNKDEGVKLKETAAQLKLLQKDIVLLGRSATKRSRRSSAGADAQSSEPSRPNAFSTPVPISDELCEFLGVEKGTLLARNEVTRRVTEYAKVNKLTVDKELVPDEKLAKLLSPADAGAKPLTTFTIQHRIKQHFLKRVAE